MKISNTEFKEPEYICPRCGNTKLSYKYVESNKSIQARCAKCFAWHGNIKYDTRPKEEIRRAAINEWKAGRI